MNNIEKVSRKFSNFLALELKFDKEKQEVIEYGIFSIIQMVISIIVTIIFGIIFNVAIEAIIVSFTIAILRKSSGGAHASTSARCVTIGTIISVGVPIIINEIYSLNNVIILSLIAFIISYYLVWKLAPIDSVAKPIKKKEKKKRLKKKSIITISVYLIMVIVNIILFINLRSVNFLNYSLCIIGGMLWQVLSLTRIMHILIEKVDFFINKFKINKEE